MTSQCSKFKEILTTGTVFMQLRVPEGPARRAVAMHYDPIMESPF